MYNSMDPSSMNTTSPMLKKKQKRKKKKKPNPYKEFDQKGKLSTLLGQSAIDEPEVFASDSGESKYSNEDKEDKDHLLTDE